MRTRKQSQQFQQSNGKEERTKRLRNADEFDDSETLSNISKDAVGRLLKRVKSRGSRALNETDDSYLKKCDSSSKLAGASGKTVKNDEKDSSKEEIAVIPSVSGTEDEIAETEWEDGSLPVLNSLNNSQEHIISGVTVELDVLPDAAKQKRIRRATAEEKELAELVHKVNLLCLLGRGRLFDIACNDSLTQASLLSLLPTHLLKIGEVPKLTAKGLTPLVGWFHRNFRVRGPDCAKKLPSFALASALETHLGTAEEVAALSVALFRALNLTTRFVAVLDVVSLKPEADKPESSSQCTGKAGSGIFNSSTLMVPRSGNASISSSKDSVLDEKDGDHQASNCRESKVKGSKFPKDNSTNKDSSVIHESNSIILDPSTSVNQSNITVEGVAETSGGLKRKGDLEFEMQLEMALSSTAIASSKRDVNSNVVDVDDTSAMPSPIKKVKDVGTEESPVFASDTSTALGSGKVGAPLYWAEVYCPGENMAGKWVHIDAVNAIIDGEQKVEAAAAACKKSLRYVVAFAGDGAKDVTRRYCTRWYKIASERVNSIWWETVLAPLKDLEAQATGGIVHLEHGASSRDNNKIEGIPIADEKMQMCRSDSVHTTVKTDNEAWEDCREEKNLGSSINSLTTTRSSLEDMELDTKTLTEPLPSNQQAYRNHPLYVIERWLKKYEILYPKGPVVGFCSGHPVYPRTCVQTLHKKERWLREGLQVKADEVPVKILKGSLKQSKAQTDEDDEYTEGDQVALYGKWQTEKLCLPHAIDGIVPKNERGQVDVWSEKCLPPGTVHLRLPRVAFVAKRLEIDFAPAMVGFEFRNGRSFPVFEGIVVCTEFRDAILEAYQEEEQRREAEERKRDEAQALSRWYQLLSSIVTRQRLKNCYGHGVPSKDSTSVSNLDTTTTRSKLAAHGSPDRKKCPGSSSSQQDKLQEKKPDASEVLPAENHEHVFLLDDEASNGTRIKRCQCGFSVQFEEF